MIAAALIACAGRIVRAGASPALTLSGMPLSGLVLSGLALAAMAQGIASTQAAEPPRLVTHQSYVEETLRATELRLDDPDSVFAWVLGSLPERVKVYPTENYYYFNFYSQGVRYAGNIRLDMMDRDKGKLHFAYFEDLQEWKADAPLTYNVFDQADGVLVEKIDYLVYRVTFRAETGRVRTERPVEGGAAGARYWSQREVSRTGVRRFRHAFLLDVQPDASRSSISFWTRPSKFQISSVSRPKPTAS